MDGEKGWMVRGDGRWEGMVKKRKKSRQPTTYVCSRNWSWSDVTKQTPTDKLQLLTLHWLSSSTLCYTMSHFHCGFWSFSPISCFLFPPILHRLNLTHVDVLVSSKFLSCLEDLTIITEAFASKKQHNQCSTPIQRWYLRSITLFPRGGCYVLLNCCQLVVTMTRWVVNWNPRLKLLGIFQKLYVELDSIFPLGGKGS